MSGGLFVVFARDEERADNGETGRVRFHGVRKELVALQSGRLGLELVQQATSTADFEAVFLGRRPNEIGETA